MGAESLGSAGRRHSLAAIIASTFGIGVNLGIVTPLVTLILERDGVDAAFILANEVGGAIGPALGGAAHERGPKFELVHQILGAKSCPSFVTFGWLTSPGLNSPRNPGTGTANVPFDDHVR